MSPAVFFLHIRAHENLDDAGRKLKIMDIRTAGRLCPPNWVCSVNTGYT